MTNNSASSDSFNTVKSDEAETWLSLLYTVLLNMFGGVGFLFAYELLRNRAAMRGFYKTASIPKFQSQYRRLVFVQPPEYPRRFMAWLWRASRFSDKEVHRLVGLDGYLVIRFCRLGFKISLFTSVLGTLILIPIFVRGGVNTSGPAILTIVNIQDGSKEMWAVVVTSWLFMLQTLRLLRDEYRRLASFRSDFLVHGDPGFDIQAQYTAMVEYLPVELRRGSTLRDFFRALFSGAVDTASVANPLEALPKLVKQRDSLVLQLEKAVTRRRVTGVEPVVSVSRELADAAGVAPWRKRPADGDNAGGDSGAGAGRIAEESQRSSRETGMSGNVGSLGGAYANSNSSAAGSGAFGADPEAGTRTGHGGHSNAAPSATAADAGDETGHGRRCGCCGCGKVQVAAIPYLQARLVLLNEQVVSAVAEKREEFGLPPLGQSMLDTERSSFTSPMHTTGPPEEEGALAAMDKNAKVPVTELLPNTTAADEEGKPPGWRVRVTELKVPVSSPMPPPIPVQRRCVTEPLHPTGAGLGRGSFDGDGAADAGGAADGRFRKPRHAQSMPVEATVGLLEVEVDDSCLDQLTSEQEESTELLRRRRLERVEHFFAALRRIVGTITRESSHEDRSTRHMLQQIVRPGSLSQAAASGSIRTDRSPHHLSPAFTNGAAGNGNGFRGGPDTADGAAAAAAGGGENTAARAHVRRRRSSGGGGGGSQGEGGSIGTTTEMAMLAEPSQWHDSNAASMSPHGDNRYGAGIGVKKLSLRDVFVFFLSGMLEGIDSMLNEFRMIFVGRSASTGFVTFRTLTARAAACQEQLTDKPGVLRMTPAPEPADIIWGNLCRSHTQIRHRRFLINIVLALGVLLWASVIAGIQAARQWLLDNWGALNNWTENSNVAKALVSNFLPSLVLLTIISLLGPIFQVIAHIYEGYKTNSQVQMAVLTRLFYYNVANVYVLITASSLSTVLSDILKNPGEIWTALGDQVPRVSVYICSVVLAKTFIGLGMELTKPGMLFVFGLRNLFMDRRFVTPRTMRKGMYQPLYAFYPIIFSGCEMTFLFALVYQCIAPLVSYCSALFFITAEMCYKHNLIFVYMPFFQTGGLMWPKLFWTVIIAAIAGQLALTGYMAIRESWHMFFCLLPQPFITTYFGRKYVKLYDGVLTRIPRNKALMHEHLLQRELERSEAEARKSGEPVGGSITTAVGDAGVSDEADATDHAGGRGRPRGRGSDSGDTGTEAGKPATVWADFSSDLYTQPALNAVWAEPELQESSRDRGHVDLLIGDEDDAEGALRGRALRRQSTFVRRESGTIFDTWLRAGRGRGHNGPAGTLRRLGEGEQKIEPGQEGEEDEEHTEVEGAERGVAAADVVGSTVEGHV